MRKFRLLLAAAVAAAIVLVSPVPAHAANTPLVYHGGPVMHHPRVYLIFWGSQWATDPSGAEYAITQTFAELPGTAINNILSQYDDGTDYIHNDVQVAGVYEMFDPAHDPGKILGGLDAPGMIQYAISHTTGWTNTPDSLFMIFPQHGTYASPSPPSGSCGYHGYQNGYIYAFIDYPYHSDEGTNVCVSDNTVDRMGSAAFHEYAEATTRPHVGNDGWTADAAGGQEIGDLCNDIEVVYGPHPQTSWGWNYNIGTVQQLWDNSTGGCGSDRGQDGYTPSNVPKHTVYGAIGSEYNGLYVAKNYAEPDLGYPTEEQASYSGGIRQRFSNGAIYSKSGVTHEVHGDIYKLYSSKYAPDVTGTLGFPQSDEIDAPNGGRQNKFSGSSCNGSGSVILWTSTTKAHEMQGCIYDYYLHHLSGPGGSYGYPTSDEQSTRGGGGRVNYMQGIPCGSTQGSGIFWSASNGTWPVHGCIFQKYESIGEDQSALGVPASDEYSTSAGIRQDFSNGYILWANGSATVYISGGSNCVDYGAYMTGPSACTGFYTTGTWFSGGGVGFKGKEIWTYANGSTKDSSAVYKLSGMDSVHAWQLQAYIPNNHSNATHAHYVITSPGGGTANGYVNQENFTNAWANVGYLCTSDGTATVTLWDDGGDAYPLQVGADAIRVVRSGIAC